MLAFMLMSSEKPFADKKRRKMIDKIMRADYTTSGPIWENISAEGKDFVANLLIVDPKQRLNATGALAHAWLKHANQHSDVAPDEDVARKLENSFIAYKETPTLKKLALNVSPTHPPIFAPSEGTRQQHTLPIILYIPNLTSTFLFLFVVRLLLTTHERTKL